MLLTLHWYIIHSYVSGRSTLFSAAKTVKIQTVYNKLKISAIVISDYVPIQ